MNKELVLILALYLIMPIIATGGVVNSPEIIDNVSPISGSLYLTNTTFNDLNIYSYNYWFNLSNLENVTRSRWKDNLSLEILDTSAPNKEKTWLRLEGTKRLHDAKLLFKVNFAEIFEKPFLGNSEYRLIDISNGAILSESEGPEIETNFRNEKSEKKSNKFYHYSVEARSLINGLKVYIWYRNDDGKWQQYWDYRDYFSTNSDWKLLEWENAPYFRELEFVAPERMLE